MAKGNSGANFGRQTNNMDPSQMSGDDPNMHKLHSLLLTHMFPHLVNALAGPSDKDTQSGPNWAETNRFPVKGKKESSKLAGNLAKAKSKGKLGGKADISKPPATKPALIP